MNEIKVQGRSQAQLPVISEHEFKIASGKDHENNVQSGEPKDTAGMSCDNLLEEFQAISDNYLNSGKKLTAQTQLDLKNKYLPYAQHLHAKILRECQNEFLNTGQSISNLKEELSELEELSNKRIPTASFEHNLEPLPAMRPAVPAPAPAFTPSDIFTLLGNVLRWLGGVFLRNDPV